MINQARSKNNYANLKDNHFDVDLKLKRREKLNEKIEERLFGELETLESKLFNLESDIEHKYGRRSPIYKEVLKLFNNEFDNLYSNFKSMRDANMANMNSKILKIQSQLKAAKQKLRMFQNLLKQN